VSVGWWVCAEVEPGLRINAVVVLCVFNNLLCLNPSGFITPYSRGWGFWVHVDKCTHAENQSEAELCEF